MSERLIYFSSSSDNTHRFVQKLGVEATRLPLFSREDTVEADQDFVLVVPTYGGGNGEPGAVPKQVIKFLNLPGNRARLRGVIGGGNTNFYDSYCLAADVIARKCRTQVLYRFELMGTPEDVLAVTKGLEELWKH